MLIIKFINNNIFLALIKIISFFINKSFYFRISFSLDFTSYISTRKRLQTAKIKIITDLIKKTLKIVIIKVKVVKDIMIMHVNKYRKEIIYNKNNIIFLLS